MQLVKDGYFSVCRKKGNNPGENWHRLCTWCYIISMIYVCEDSHRIARSDYSKAAGLTFIVLIKAGEVSLC